MNTEISPNMSAEDRTPDTTTEKPMHSKRRYVSILLAAFMVNFTACGLLFGFGDYQTLYESIVLQDDNPFSGASTAQIDLIGTLSISMMTIGAPFTMSLAKNFPPQLVVCAGGLLFGLANIAASFGKSLWHFQLAQGLLLGIGTCLSFMPSMTIAPTWFGARRALAMGFISAGTGFGGLVWAPVITACFDAMGFRNTLRLTGALSTALLCASGSALEWEPSLAVHFKSERAASAGTLTIFRVPLPSKHMAKQPKFILQALSAALQSAAYYTPVFFLVSYATTLGYSAKDGANFTAISNACNAIGKISAGLAADKLGRLNSFFATTFISAVVTLGLWIPSTVIGTSNEPLARSLFISFTVLYGIFASAYISLFPPALIELFGMRQLPQITGVMYLMQGSAALVGTPVAGMLVRHHGAAKTSEDYLGMSILVGSLMAACTVAVGCLRVQAASAPKRTELRSKWKL